MSASFLGVQTFAASGMPRTLLSSSVEGAWCCLQQASGSGVEGRVRERCAGHSVTLGMAAAGVAMIEERNISRDSHRYHAPKNSPAGRAWQGGAGGLDGRG